MKEQQYAAIIECASNGRFYIPEARKRGLLPLVIYPKLPLDSKDTQYGEVRAHVRDYLDETIPVIDAPEDFDELMTLLKPYPIACVLAGSEFGVPMADELSKRLGLPGNDPKKTSLKLEKPAMQAALKEAGLRYIRGRTITSVQDGLDFWKELNVERVVIKPPAGAGTVGLHFCKTHEELAYHLESLFSERDLYGRTVNEVLMQEYINGTEYIVNTVSCAGIHRITDLWMYNKVAVGSEGNAYDYVRLMTHLEPGHKELIEYAYAALDALGYEYGPGHGEFMIDQYGPVLIEIGARPMGGNYSMDLMDACLGHHLTDCAMDAYLEPERFEKDRKSPYHPAMEMMLKYFIAPKEQNVSTLPVLPILKHLSSFRRLNITGLMESSAISKTVDLLTAPACFELCHPDPKVLMEDYRTIRHIEQNYFQLLFAENAGKKISPDRETLIEEYHSLPEGRSFLLLDDKELCLELLDAGITAVTIEELETLPDGQAGGLFSVSSAVGLEECFDLVPVFADKLCPGGIMKVSERSYAGFPYGSTGYELMMRLCDIDILQPLHGQRSILTGIKNSQKMDRTAELEQADWFVHLRDDQWLLPERRANQEGLEICEKLRIRPGLKVYDCPCGDARISYQMALYGADITGMDINPRFVEKARERFRALGIKGKFHTGDMRDASYPGGCDLLLNWFNSFGYFSEEENREHMKTMARCIRPGGILLLESPNPTHILDNVESKYEENGEQIEKYWDPEKKRMIITYPPQNDQEEVIVSVRIYEVEEYRQLFEEAGLILEEAFGEHFTPLTSDSLRIILIARKPDTGEKKSNG